MYSHMRRRHKTDWWGILGLVLSMLGATFVVVGILVFIFVYFLDIKISYRCPLFSEGYCITSVDLSHGLNN